MIVPGSFEVASYTLDTGEKLWWVRGLAWQLKSVPVVDHDRIYVSGWEIGGDEEHHPKLPEFGRVLQEFDADHDGKLSRRELPAEFSAQWWGDNDLNHDGVIDEREWQFYLTRSLAENCLVAIRAGGRGDVTKSRVLWRYRKALPNTSSPLLYQGVLYLIRDGIFTSLNPETGEAYKLARLTGALGFYWSSPVAADGKIILASGEGKIVTVRADAEWSVLSIINLDDDIFATPAIVDSQVYIRSRTTLYCFAKKSK